MSLDRALRYAYLAAAIGWAIALPLAAAAAAAPHAAAGEYAFAALAYAAGGLICHQQAGRSYHLWGVQLPVCARCTGIYVGAAAAGIILAASALVARKGNALLAQPRTASAQTVGNLDRAVFIAACVPMALTLVFEWTTGITPSNTIRALSGLPVGAAVTWAVIVPRR